MLRNLNAQLAVQINSIHCPPQTLQQQTPLKNQLVHFKHKNTNIKESQKDFTCNKTSHYSCEQCWFEAIERIYEVTLFTVPTVCYDCNWNKTLLFTTMPRILRGTKIPRAS